MSATDWRDELPSTVNIPIDWHIPENLSSAYASNVFVQSGEYEIVLSFFQPMLPLLAGSDEEKHAKLAQMETIRAECVSRVIVHPDLVPKIISAMQSVWEQHTAAKKLHERRGEA